MQKSISPFSKAQLMPKEERLEVSKDNVQLRIGLPKERSYQEKRICLTPDAVSALTNNGHQVIIEAGAGNNAAFEDKEYSEAGAEISNDTANTNLDLQSPLSRQKAADVPTINPLDHLRSCNLPRLFFRHKSLGQSSAPMPLE